MKTTHLARLLASIARNDLGSARVIADEFVAEEAKRGHHDAALRLRGALHGNGHGSAHRISPAVEDAALSRCISELEPRARLDDVCLRPKSRALLRRLVQEFELRDRLQAAAIPRRSRILFIGPPGCGKSMTAVALATELKMPCFLVQFNALVGPYLGQTASNLHQLFQFASSDPCVTLLDEIDALGQRRGGSRDVAEVDRVVIAMMQELEHSRPAGLVVATSNRPESLDPALIRRFDVTVEFPRPTTTQRRSFLSKRASALGLPVGPRRRLAIGRAASFAEIERILVDLARDRVIEDGRRPS